MKNNLFSTGVLVDQTDSTFTFVKANNRFTKNQTVDRTLDVSFDWFYTEKGDVQLVGSNVFYLLYDYVTEKSDILLPKNPKPMDYVVLHYHQDILLQKIDLFKPSRILIRGEKERIMGYDEPLYCDMMFTHLTLKYFDKALGWVIV